MINYKKFIALKAQVYSRNYNCSIFKILTRLNDIGKQSNYFLSLSP